MALLLVCSIFLSSKILGWFLICSASFFSLLTTCYARCRSKVSYLQLSFWKMYAQKEKEQLENTFVDYAKKLSDRNLKCFLENKRPDVFPMPTFAAWEAASELHSFHQNRQHYSTLHRVVEEGLDLRPEDEETTMMLMGTAQNMQFTHHHWLTGSRHLPPASTATGVSLCFLPFSIS